MTAVRTELVEEVVAYTRTHLGAATAAGLDAAGSDPRVVLVEAVCVLTCADEFPPPPLGTAVLAVVEDAVDELREQVWAPGPA